MKFVQEAVHRGNSMPSWNSGIIPTPGSIPKWLKQIKRPATAEFVPDDNGIADDV